MRLDVGPVAPMSAVAWMEWVRGTLSELGRAAASSDGPSIDALAHLRRHLEQWIPRKVATDETLRWSTDIDPDELEYLVHTFYTLEVRMAPEVRRGKGNGIPDEGRTFHLVLVRALLDTLESVSPSRAAFVDQLRWSWPSAVEAS